jgi:hypothetical protein
MDHWARPNDASLLQAVLEPKTAAGSESERLGFTDKIGYFGT